MKKYLFIIFSFVSSQLAGQRKVGLRTANELSLYAGAGLSQLKYEALSSPAAGGLAGLGYRYYLSGQWSLGTGAELQLYTTRITLDQVRGSSDARDVEGSSFQFRYEAKNYREDQRAYYIAVPLNVQFETGASKTSWYMNIGGKVAYNIHARYQAKASGLTTTGYYPQWNVELADPAFMGFGQWDDARSAKNDFKTKTAFLLSVETGIKTRDRFYLGVYADYGLNNILEAGERHAVIRYVTDSPTAFSYQSVPAALDAEGKPWAQKLNLLSLGIKLRYILN